ncbi:phosphotransferase enzyme family protein [Streptomyces sp. NPDC050433]|uniref:phosphotransferase enzyme family protein n=1 Tax=Streptomyces sp. NPDC050433 TaxID=3365615 RepID=UPI0037A72433
MLAETTERSRLGRAVAAHGVRRLVGVRETGSENDRTWIADTDEGRTVVIKEFPADPSSASSARMQAALLAHVARADPRLPVPRLLTRENGRPITVEEGRSILVTTFCTGVPLEDVTLDEATVDSLAEVQARLLSALRNADPGELSVPARSEWSLDAILDVEHLIPVHAPPVLRATLEEIGRGFREHVIPVRDTLPAQVVHADCNLSNVLVEEGAVSGVIDFGDAVHAPRVYDIAVTACYLGLALGDLEHTLVDRYLAAIGRACGLDGRETSLIRSLVLVRVALVILLGRESARRAPARADYQLRYDHLAERVLLARAARTTEKEE